MANSDPTKDPKFKQVVDHFLKTPPKPHTKKEPVKRQKGKKVGDQNESGRPGEDGKEG
jgi:hypothetical protein